jgi:2-polyprenyl-3-methyl-5-hydroxy-6-metoxy-1,4-benzoquinol methylase
LPGPFELARCGACGSAVTVGEAPPDAYETGAYRPVEPRLTRGARRALDLFDRQRLGLLRPYLRPGAALLDVGAGRGRFVASAEGAGYSARGIEPSRRGVQAALSGGIVLQRAGWEDAEVEPESLDAVVFWHVLEHLDDPAAAAARAAAWLRPAGVLLAGVPNLDSWQARVGGDRWYHLDVARHRVHFTASGLDALLRGAGLQPQRTHHLLAEHNPFGMWQSAVSRFTDTPSWLYHALKRNAPLWSRDAVITAAAVPLAPVAVLAELAAGLAGRGGTIAVVARRARPRVSTASASG